ncbi:unnamed protein product [Bubo scandiacus]
MAWGQAEKAYPEFVLTYLEELNERGDDPDRKPHSPWGLVCSSSGDRQQLSRRGHSIKPEAGQRQSFQKHVLQKNVSNPNQKQLSGPLDAHLMPADPLGETTQLTVALVRKLEEKHPKASAQSVLLIAKVIPAMKGKAD